ncbi:MAG: AfsR/SARP family transcriptional regulator, partial [Chloroflexota bacterium]
MTTLDLRLLGPPQIAASSATLHFPTRKTLALLVYLAVEGGIHSRDALAALLWPDSDGSRARANLRNTLNYLRNTLPAGESGATPHLIVERDALGFNAQAPHSLDWQILEKAAAGDDERLLQQALDCYRGDFLQGFTPGDAPQFDHWVSLHREIAHRQMNAVLDRLSRSRFEAGDWQGARQTVDRWLVHDELQEAAYQRLMRIQLAQGNRAAALQTYERCAAVLRDELN